MQALGNYIDGAFVPPSGTALVSRNPAADGAVVFETGFTVGAVRDAASAAANEAKTMASSAQSAADAAKRAADQANACCSANTEKMDRMFKSSQKK